MSSNKEISDVIAYEVEEVQEVIHDPEQEQKKIISKF